MTGNGTYPAGNDSIVTSGSEVEFKYASGDGKDVIYGFADNDLLKITDSGKKEARMDARRAGLLSVTRSSGALSTSVRLNVGTMKTQRPCEGPFLFATFSLGT